MLQNVGDWYSVTDLKTDDAKLIARRTAGAALVETWGKASVRVSDLLDASAYALELADTVVADNPIGAAVCAEISNAQPSFDIEKERDGQDPRICAAMALSELLAQRAARSSNWRRTEREVLIAEAFMSALRFRQMDAGKFLQERLQRIYDQAASLLRVMDASRRLRRGEPASLIQSARAITDVASIQKLLTTAFETVFRDVELDREELQALWWVFGGVSIVDGKPFSELSPTEAAVCAGSELAGITNWPGTSPTSALAARIINTEADFDGANLDSERIQRLLTEEQRGLVRRWPSIFPLLSLASAPERSEVKLSALLAKLTAKQAAQQAFGEFSLLRQIP
jgi:hypothetical protein